MNPNRLILLWTIVALFAIALGALVGVLLVVANT